MNWIDIASIVFVCVTANHLGLIKAIETVINHHLPIISCPKCLTFWLTLTYQLVTGCHPLTSLAISFLCSYLAIWLELFEGIIDSLYNRIYEKIYTEPTDNETAADDDENDTDCAVSDLR